MRGFSQAFGPIRLSAQKHFVRASTDKRELPAKLQRYELRNRIGVIGAITRVARLVYPTDNDYTLSDNRLLGTYRNDRICTKNPLVVRQYFLYHICSLLSAWGEELPFGRTE